MTELLLYRANVRAALEQMSRERMTQRMAARWLIDAGRPNCHAHSALHGLLIEMMAPTTAATWIVGEASGRKHVLPSPFMGCRRILARQRIGKIYAADSCRAIAIEQGTPRLEVSLQRQYELISQGYDTVASALTVTDKDGAVLKVEIFDPQPHALQQPQPRTILQTSDEPVTLG